jgi:hypothetical protein
MSARRLALLLAAMAPLAASASPALAETPGNSFTPPLGQPVVLTRTLVRQLFDGQEIVTVRTWQILFRPEASGWLVTGTLLDSKVTAPPRLGPLAEIERARPDEGLFPLRLDAAGVMAARDAGFGGDTAAFDEAVGIVSGKVAAKGGDDDKEGQTAEGRRFLAQLQGVAAGPIVAHWPDALFAAAAQSAPQSRSFILPDGKGGSFTSSVTRSGQSVGGLPETVERRITTTIAGQSNTTIERWSFAAE